MAKALAWGGIAHPVVRALASLGLWRVRCRVCGAPCDPADMAHGRPFGLEHMLCPSCAERLTVRREGFCPRCGHIHALANETPHLCGACLSAPPPWERLFFHGVYDGLLRQLLLDYKFHNRLGLSGLLQAMAAEALAARGDGPHASALACVRYDRIIPIPLHATRLVWRGYNQSLELARLAARVAGVPLDTRALVRCRATRPQVELDMHEREENLKGAFCVDRAAVAGQTILLADDIMTTGATLREASHMLLATGARRVDVLVLARASRG